MIGIIEIIRSIRTNHERFDLQKLLQTDPAPNKEKYDKIHEVVKATGWCLSGQEDAMKIIAVFYDLPEVLNAYDHQDQLCVVKISKTHWTAEIRNRVYVILGSHVAIWIDGDEFDLRYPSNFVDEDECNDGDDCSDDECLCSRTIHSHYTYIPSSDLGQYTARLETSEFWTQMLQQTKKLRGRIFFRVIQDFIEANIEIIPK